MSQLAEFALLVTLAFLWVPFAWAFMSWRLPREVLERYFREPHFNKGELIVFGSFPSNVLLRTGVFMAACFQERYRRGRRLDGYLDLMPHWYVRASKLLCLALVLHLGTVLALWWGMYLYLKVGD